MESLVNFLALIDKCPRRIPLNGTIMNEIFSDSVRIYKSMYISLYNNHVLSKILFYYIENREQN